jgi:hypothetical protein
MRQPSEKSAYSASFLFYSNFAKDQAYFSSLRASLFYFISREWHISKRVPNGVRRLEWNEGEGHWANAQWERARIGKQNLIPFLALVG